MREEQNKPARNRFRKIEVRMWGDEKFRRLSALPPCGQGLWVFLLTGPHTGPIPGVFRSGRAAMAEELDWEIEAFDKAFGEAFREGLVKADWKAKVVWIPNAIKCNRPESPNVVRSWGGEWDLIPECDLKAEVYESLKANICGLGEAFEKAFVEAFGKAYGKPSRKTCPNQEQEQDGKTTLSASRPTAADVQTIFDYWRERMNSPRSKLDDKRRKAIKDALKSYEPRDLCLAIKGCSLTPHNMGFNDRHTKFNDISLILRDAAHIDRFMGNANNPSLSTTTSPGVPMSKQKSVMDESERNLAAYTAMVNGHDPSAHAADDPMTIDMEM